MERSGSRRCSSASISAHGTLSYDAATQTTEPFRFDCADITSVNRTMAARMPHAAWADLLGHDRSLILATLPTDCDLTEEEDAAVSGTAVASVAAAIATMRAPGLNLATTTKVLHLKRPALVPVLDSLVLQQVGGGGRPTVKVLEHLRNVGRANLKPLRDVQAHLAGLTGDDGQPTRRTRVRILDALLWSTHPASVLYPYVRRSYKEATAADVSDEMQEAACRALLPAGARVRVISDSRGHHSGFSAARDGYQALLGSLTPV